MQIGSGLRWVRILGSACCGAAAIGSAAAAGRASELVYHPINPSFGGNPFNSSHLITIANEQNDFEAPRPRSSSAAPTSPADLFVRQLQSRLLSALADQVTQAIFGDHPQDSGQIVLGDQTVSFERLLDSIHLTIFDASTGASTDISVPTLVTP